MYPSHLNSPFSSATFSALQFRRRRRRRRRRPGTRSARRPFTQHGPRSAPRFSASRRKLLTSCRPPHAFFLDSPSVTSGSSVDGARRPLVLSRPRLCHTQNASYTSSFKTRIRPSHRISSSYLLYLCNHISLLPDFSLLIPSLSPRGRFRRTFLLHFQLPPSFFRSQ